MIKPLLLAILLGLPMVSFGASLDITWDRPTTREGGLPMPPEDIGGYEVYLTDATNSNPVLIGTADGLAEAASLAVDITLGDVVYFTMRVFDTDLIYSEYSTSVQYTKKRPGKVIIRSVKVRFTN